MRKDKSDKYFRKNESTIFGELLLNELDIIKPNNVFCIGKKAEDFFKENNLSKRTLYLPHPSGSNANTWKRYLINQKPEDKMKYLKTEIDKYLD